MDIAELVARSNQATLWLTYHQQGFKPSSPRTLRARIRQLELDGRLLASLPETFQDQWRKCRPSGLIDVDVNLAFDGAHWRPDISAQCLDVSFAHHKFPYRLDHGKGTVRLKGDFLEVHMTAQAGSRPIRLDAEVHKLGLDAVGWFEAKGDAVPLDEKLLIALRERPRAVVRSLHPGGTIDFYVRLSREAPKAPLRKHLRIGLNHCSMRYEKFPYPLGNIRGMIEMRDDRWTLHDLEGSNDTGRVLCEGYFTPVRQGHELLLQLSAADVPLEPELRDALQPNIRQIWDELRPRGRIDLGCEIRYVPGAEKLRIRVRAEPQGDSTSIEPLHFRYRLEKLQGVLTYSDGHVTLKRFKAEHGPVKISAGGHCNLRADGGWRFHFDTLAVDRLRLDRELTQALPARLRTTVGRLKLGGPINLRGSCELAGSGRPGEPLQSQWDLIVGLHQGSIDCGVKLKIIYCDVTLIGASDGRRFHTRGELDVDSLTYKDCQFTEVRGPLWIDDQHMLLGSWADRQEGKTAQHDGSPPRQPRPLTAKLFGGTAFGDGWVAFGAAPRYALQAALTRADLGRCAREVIGRRQNLRGAVDATLDLRGNGLSKNAMVGRGNVQLRNADIYELPLMIALLKILSVRVPDSNAFSTSDIDFRIQGEHIYFDRIDFRGDAISLLGKGEMDFQQAIRLTFHAIVGRGEFEMPVLKELVHDASRQMMLIHVGGTLANPVTRPVAFPGVNQALQQLSDELQR